MDFPNVIFTFCEKLTCLSSFEIYLNLACLFFFQTAESVFPQGFLKVLAEFLFVL
jgi:hypothetical protein